MDALRERLDESLQGSTLNVTPHDLGAFICSPWSVESRYLDADRPLEYQDVKLVDNPLMLEGVAILVKDDTVQAVVNLEDGRSMETL